MYKFVQRFNTKLFGIKLHVQGEVAAGIGVFRYISCHSKVASGVEGFPINT